jgi:hypothetical protein
MTIKTAKSITFSAFSVHTRGDNKYDDSNILGKGRLQLSPERRNILSCSWWRKNSGGAELLRNLGQELSHRVPEEESEMGIGEPTILPREICDAIERRPNRLNNLQFVKEFDDHLRRESQILVWMGQLRDSAWTRSELAENIIQSCPNMMATRIISFKLEKNFKTPQTAEISRIRIVEREIDPGYRNFGKTNNNIMHGE